MKTKVSNKYLESEEKEKEQTEKESFTFLQMAMSRSSLWDRKAIFTDSR